MPERKPLRLHRFPCGVLQMDSTGYGLAHFGIENHSFPNDDTQYLLVTGKVAVAETGIQGVTNRLTRLTTLSKEGWWSLHRLIIGSGSVWRFYALFAVAFTAYSVGWIIG